MMTSLRPLLPALGCVLLGATLQACSGPPAASGPAVRYYAADMNGGAKLCEVSKPAVSAGKVVDATMKVSSSGGWCGLPVSNGGRAFDAGLLTSRPEHGKPQVHTVGLDTRIDSTPEFGITGTDQFTVQLLPGEGAVRVTVTVTR